MSHYDCTCCGEALGVSHDHCDNCKAGRCSRAEPTLPQPAEAPASEWAYELAGRIVLGNQGVGNAASIIEQAFAEREAAADAAGFRRGVEAAAKVANEEAARRFRNCCRKACEGVAYHSLALIETQEKG